MMGESMSQNNKRIFGVSEALESLALNKKWSLENEDFSTLLWIEEDSEPPTEEQVLLEIVRLTEKEIERVEAEHQAEVDRERARQSAIAKLTKLGLTEDEALALVK